MRQSFLVLCVMLFAACGETVVVNQPAGITCTQTEQCPLSTLECVAGICKEKPSADFFQVGMNSTYEFLDEQGTLLMLWSSMDADYTVDISGSNFKASGHLAKYSNTPVTVTGLAPNTPYVALLTGTAVKTGDVAYSYTTFRTTQPKDPHSNGPPPTFSSSKVSVLDYDGKVAHVVFDYNLTQLGRPYLRFKYRLNDNWSYSYVGSKESGPKSFDMNFVRPPNTVQGEEWNIWFLLEVRDLADNITDSQLLTLNFPN